MSSLLEAMDELHYAHDLVRLIAMTARTNPDDDAKALAVGCEMIE